MILIQRTCNKGPLQGDLLISSARARLPLQEPGFLYKGRLPSFLYKGRLPSFLYKGPASSTRADFPASSTSSTRAGNTLWKE